MNKNFNNRENKNIISSPQFISIDIWGAFISSNMIIYNLYIKLKSYPPGFLVPLHKNLPFFGYYCISSYENVYSATDINDKSCINNSICADSH